VANKLAWVVQKLIMQAGLDQYLAIPEFRNRKASTDGKILAKVYNDQLWFVEHGNGTLAVYLPVELEVVS
jgi:hypothetical protein